MNRIPFSWLAWLLTTFVAVFLAASVTRAQDPAPIQPQAPAASTSQPSQPNPDIEWLAKVSKLYYSSARAGLTGFDCAVHPDWHKLVVSANKGQAAPEDSQQVALLKTVKVGIHARMKGGSTVDWVAESTSDKPLDESSTALLDGMHKSVEQTLEGFLQFWGPFMEAAVVPDSLEGLDIKHTPTTHTIHAKQGGTELTEVFSSDLVLEQFNVDMSGTSIKFTPTYKPTPKGLLVTAFDAHVLPAGVPAEQAQVMKVGIEYQDVGELTIPSNLNMDVAGTGVFDYGFDGCTANPK